VISIKVHGRATTIDRFPFPLKKAGETPESLPDVDMNVLSFPSLGFPECCKGYAPGSQTYRRYRAKSMRAANDRILTVEGELASAVCCSQSDIFQYFIDATVQVEIRSTHGIAQFRLKFFRQCLIGCCSGFFGNSVQCCSTHVDILSKILSWRCFSGFTYSGLLNVVRPAVSLNGQPATLHMRYR